MTEGPLIQPAALRDLSGDIRLLDIRSRAAFEAGHLAGALHADLDRDLSTAADRGFDPAQGGRHPLPPLDRWCARLGAWGIGPETPVVLYDDTFAAMGAARAWWMLRAIGHTRVQVLDGGFQAAQRAGLDLVTQEAAPTPLSPYPCTAWQRPTVDRAWVEAHAADPSWCLLDVRSRERHEGRSEPLDPVAGHIPGARNLPLTSNLDESGQFLAPDRLKEMYLELLCGLPIDRLVLSCGSGVSACHTLLALEAAGLDGAALYVGSYSEWCRSLPVATGPA